MTVSTEAAMLAAVQTSIKALSPASPATSTSRVYIYPDDYSTMPAVPKLPFVVVRLGYGPIQNEQHGLASVFRNGTLSLEFYTAQGAMHVPSTEHAASELKKRQWWLVVATWLLSDRTLTDTVIQIGGVSGFSANSFFTDERVYLQWNQDEYDGLYINIPFTQELC